MGEIKETIATSVLLSREQHDFVMDQSKRFVLSKFVREKLGEYMIFIKEVENGKKRIIG